MLNWLSKWFGSDEEPERTNLGHILLRATFDDGVTCDYRFIGHINVRNGMVYPASLKAENFKKHRKTYKTREGIVYPRNRVSKFEVVSEKPWLL
jgi:hypothetical protein